MKKLYKLILLPVILLTGCSSPPTVYVYAKYLNENQKNVLSTQFKKEDYNVEFNRLDFPTTINENSMLYSLFLQEPELIARAKSIVENMGLPLESISALTSGNHWYTKNSVALFLFPNNKRALGAIFRQDLSQTYQAEKCGGEHTLRLNEDGTFRLIEKPLSEKSLFEKPKVTKGSWFYRQYPYLELQKQGANYSEYYFEISNFTKHDKVSEIEFVKLAYLNSSHFVEGCYFLHGTRRTD